MLIKEIQQAQLQARKAKDSVAAECLTTLYAEASMIGKNEGNRDTTDAETVQMIKKFLKNVEEMMSVCTTRGVEIPAKTLREKDILMSFLPQQLTEEQVKAIVSGLMVELGLEKNPKAMGVLMKTLKERYEGQYDGSMASKLIKEVLA